MTDPECKSTVTESSKGPEEEDVPPASPDVHFEPIIKLDEVEVKTFEEDEDVLFKMRAKLFRFDKPLKEWKERGTGDVRFLQHKETKKHNCAGVNTYLNFASSNDLSVIDIVTFTPEMQLSPNVGSDRSWVWNVAADISDGESKPETLAIRFANTENAQIFKEKFLEAQKINSDLAKKGHEVKEKDAKNEKNEDKDPE
ncbi:3325_t:CDS:2 [Cetraspora pellucida]|uniref:3325_t:CDS:1 n=1 Tax=Cetraspora pellucida TaxID=1433469 RepID=A0ACA9MTX4_9GLOM|nr:3325_t:CDS:2 [Cetraspora pellucida]